MIPKMVDLITKVSKHSHAIDRLLRATDQAKEQRRSHASSSTDRPHKLRTRLGEDALEQIVAEYLAGDSTRTLATRHGISKTAVLRAIRKAGHQPRPRGPHPTKTQAAESSGGR